ncbi:hypothetical protein [Streptomyces sp. NPDC054838]
MTDATAHNAAATYLPMDPEEPDTLPCIEIAGAQVYAYVDESGTLRVSVHLDAGDVTALARPDGTVPLRVKVNDDVVFTG